MADAAENDVPQRFILCAPTVRGEQLGENVYKAVLLDTNEAVGRVHG